MKTKYITSPEAAKMKGVSEATIRIWCNRGYLKGAYKSGKTWIIPTTSLDTHQPIDAGKRASKYGKAN